MLIRSTTADDIEGQPCGQHGAGIDITERKQREEALRRSEEKYRQPVDDIGDIIYGLDAAGTVTSVSPATESAFGYTPAEIVGRPFTDFVAATDVPAVMQDCSGALSGKHYPPDRGLVAKSDAVCWVRNSARAVIENVQVTGLHGVLTDLTDRWRMEQGLRALTAELDTRLIERTRELSEALDQRKRAEERADRLPCNRGLRE